MNRLLIIVGIVVAAVVAFFVARFFLDGGSGENLTGTWAVAAVEERGEKIPAREIPFKAIKFEGGQVVWIVATREGLAEARGNYQTDPTKSPKHIDIDFPAKGGMVLIPAVYDIDGDGMVLALGDRPSDFSGKNATLMYLKRQRQK